jgi:hypothetical protein
MAIKARTKELRRISLELHCAEDKRYSLTVLHWEAYTRAGKFWSEGHEAKGRTFE